MNVSIFKKVSYIDGEYDGYDIMIRRGDCKPERIGQIGWTGDEIKAQQKIDEINKLLKEL